MTPSDTLKVMGRPSPGSAGGGVWAAVAAGAAGGLLFALVYDRMAAPYLLAELKSQTPRLGPDDRRSGAPDQGRR
jgi:hypothetical protein